jgi:hypothetical protein
MGLFPSFVVSNVDERFYAQSVGFTTTPGLSASLLSYYAGLSDGKVRIRRRGIEPMDRSV